MFLALAVAAGLVSRMSPSEICDEFILGAKDMLPAALMVGIGASVGLILSDGCITDTIVYHAAQILQEVPFLLQGSMMYFANTIINIFLTSGTAQAAVVAPIFVPIADMIGMTRQTAALAYNFGDGFSNYVLPMSSALMGVLSAANIPYDRWMRFMWKLFLVWMALSCAFLTIAQLISLH